ncbi:MAG TPA: type VI immunity family protein [Archangium sp.]|uniref:type VI immunity family protein n=1 Tax=Archangium sp. TaxID=1872627 RepID=UPI002E3051C6|nr:type VI immunity family protein [Archangium sp.]HEX5747253.1 type VI immunity family protein [Archangium sp.]
MPPSQPRIRIQGTVRNESYGYEKVGEELVKKVREHVYDRVLARDVVRIIFFLPHHHHHLTTGVTHALDSYLHAIEGCPGALSRYTCCWWESFDLTEPSDWARIRETLEPKEPRFFEDYEPHDARFAEKDGADPYFTLFGEQGNGYSFSYHARLPWREPHPHSVSVLSATLPTEYLEEHGAQHVQALAMAMASRLPFATGHAGLALELWHPIYAQLDRLRTELFRHPGFDVREASHFDGMGTLVDGIHWMNFLGPPLLSELGGAAGLRARLHSPTTTVQEMEDERAVVTLGAEPEAGDTAQGQMLPAYRELARLLEPYLEPFPWGFLARKTPSVEEELRRWWRRFLD